MDLSPYWLRNIKLHANKLSKITCHVYFLEACLTLGLTPVGLTIKPALSGMPPYMWPSVKDLAHQQSIELTTAVLKMYKQQIMNHSESLQNLVQLALSNYPNLIETINNIIQKAVGNMEQEAEKKLKKLSNICVKHLQNNNSIGLQIPQRKAPLISEKPSLASLLGLPTPAKQQVILPFHKPKSTTNNLEIKPTSTELQICNISSHTLSETEKMVLSKGLSFCPTPSFDHFSLIKDIMTLARKLRIKQHFSNNPADSDTNTSSGLERFKPPSDWDPPPLPPDHPIEQYINFLVQNVSDPTFAASISNSTENNLSFEEKKAIKSLKNNNSIMILPADKGSTTVIMDKVDYIAEIEKQLSDTTTYRQLKNDPTQAYKTELISLINNQAKANNIAPETLKLLIPNNPITPKIYILPKIHKAITPPPGRPIVAGCDSLTERTSAYVDSFLQPIVQNLPSYLKDSNDFLDKLSSIKQPLPKHTIIATIDVTSLYTNIPHVHGLSAAEDALNKYRTKGSLPTTSFITTLIKFILEKNNFQFLDRHFLQITGTAMGTKMAPSYANLFMGKFEESFLKSQEQKPLCWLRYIDDIFIIWTHGHDNLTTFLDNLNNFSTLQFTWNFSEHTIDFLDVTLKLTNGKISTSVHIKPTNHQQYLHFNSCHPNNTKRSLPYSLALRGKRITSDEKDLFEYNRKIQSAFENRGYPPQLVRSQISAAQLSNDQPPKTKDSPETTNLITTFHPGLHKLNSLLKTGFKILDCSSQTKGLLERPPSVVYRQPSNLKNLLVHPKLPDPSKPRPEILQHGSYPCNENRCKTCQVNLPTNTFTSSFHKTQYQIKGHHTCSSENLIYQLECKQCQAQYIGLTTETLRKRMNGHRHDVKTEKEKPVAQHANSHSLDFNDCFTTKVLKSIPKNQCNSSLLRRWELAYQFVTSSRTSPNLNIR